MSLNNLTYSAKGIALTEQFEGCRLIAYQDQVGVWTIGYGHTGPDVTPGLIITQAQAQALLERDVSSATACVNNSVLVKLTQEEFDALVDFVFNVGASAFKGSRCSGNLNAGDFPGAAGQFELWDHARVVNLELFLTPPSREAALFNSGNSSPQSG